MKSDKRDLSTFDCEFGEERTHGLDMRVGDGAFEFRERRTSPGGVGDHLSEGKSHLAGIFERRAGAGFDARIGVAADQGDVDAVHRGAADHADRGIEPGGLAHSAAPIKVVTAPIPSISPSSRSPGATGPTPAGVPVKMRSPAPR